MNEPTFRVFVSSTWLDLGPERAAVRDAVLRMKQTQFVGMEYFGSRDETTRQASLEEVDDSRVYVGIIAARYGSGITEAEYRRARSRGLPCLIYFKDAAAIRADLCEPDAAQTAKLDALKAELLREHDVSTFTNPDHLAALLTADLHRLLSSLRGADVTLIPTLHQLRAAVGDFVGREKEIADLLATLRGGASAAITGISGMGGIGKTELSFYVAERLRDTYPDAQLVLDMRGTDDPPRDPADALASCIRAFLGLEQRLPDDIEQLTRLYRSILEGKRALILLDNTRDSAQVRPLLPPPGSALLITSRNAITLPGMRRTMLDQLQPNEARELLTGIAPRVPANTADQICYLCGYLPLAIRAAGSLLAVADDLDPAEYVAQLRDERTRLERIGVDPLIGVDVTASFNLSYARLSPGDARVFRQLAVFPATFDARAEEAVCEDPGHKHLSELLRRNLVLYNRETHRYRLHDLMRLFADDRLSETERDASQLRHAAQYLRVLWDCHGFYSQGGESIQTGLALFDAEWMNIETGQEWARELSGQDETATRLCNDYPYVGAYLLDLRQHPREGIHWREAALAAARQLKDRVAEGRHLSNLGVAYRNLGELRRAIEYYEQALVVLREVGSRQEEGSVLNNLGLVYADLGEIRRSIELYLRHLLITREIGDRRGEGVVLNNLGLAYAALGETHRTVEFYEKALVVLREVGDRRSEGSALGNLGLAYADLGDPQRAVEFYKQALVIHREIGNRYSEGIVLFNLGLALDALGNRAQAIAYAEAALKIFKQMESPHVETVRVRLAGWREGRQRGSEGL